MARRALSQCGLLASLRDVLTPRSLPLTIGEVQGAARDRVKELRAAGRATDAAEVGWCAREWVRVERKRLKALEKYAAHMDRCMADPEFRARVHGGAA